MYTLTSTKTFMYRLDRNWDIYVARLSFSGLWKVMICKNNSFISNEHTKLKSRPTTHFDRSSTPTCHYFADHVSSVVIKLAVTDWRSCVGISLGSPIVLKKVASTLITTGLTGWLIFVWKEIVGQTHNCQSKTKLPSSLTKHSKKLLAK